MASIKGKLLEALNFHWDDLTEERLLDILMDSYRAKQNEIIRLEGENAQEREYLYADREALHKERAMFARNPINRAIGTHSFATSNQEFEINITHDGIVSLYIKHNKYSVAVPLKVS